MTELENKWIQEAMDAIDQVKNGIDVFAELKRKAALAQNYEKATQIRDKEIEFKEKLLRLFVIKTYK